MELIDLTIEESFPRGAYICSALVNGYRVHSFRHGTKRFITSLNNLQSNT